jgi:hypothetical protein
MRSLLSLGLLMAWGAGLFAAPASGLTVARFQGDARCGKAAALLPLARGKALAKGDQIVLAAHASARFRLAELCDMGLEGPARLQIISLRRVLEDGKRQWQARLRLEEGCLWIDTRYAFQTPVDIVLELPQGTLKVPNRVRYLVRAQPIGEALALMDAQGRSLTARRAMNGAGLEPASLTRPAELLCDAAVLEAQKAPMVLVLAEDYDKARKARPRKPVLAPALMQALSASAGVSFADQSGSTRLARKAAAALKGNDSLARRVGRELSARWVLVGNSLASEVKPPAKAKGRKKLTVVKAVAEARVLDVISGATVAFDAANTRFAVAKGQSLAEARGKALDAVSLKLAEYMAFHMGTLAQGETHATALQPMSVKNVRNAEQATRLRDALGSLESVKRVIFRKWAEKRLRLDLMLRVAPKDLREQLTKMDLSPYRLVPASLSDESGLIFSLEAIEK